MTLTDIGEQYRVPIRKDECGDRIIRGRNGHLYTDAGRIMVCFTDDGRKTAFPSIRFKNARLKMLPGIKIRQHGDMEFTGEITAEQIPTALFSVLGVKRFKSTKGQAKDLPPGLVAYKAERRLSRTRVQEP